MVKELVKLNFTGWNLFLRGTRMQRFIAYVVIGAIEGGTKVFIESATGIRKKRREEALRREKELYDKLEKFKVDVNTDFEQQIKEALEETLNPVDELAKRLEEAKKNVPMNMDEIEYITQELIKLLQQD